MKSGIKNLNLGLFLLRLVVGGVFLYHGIDKLTHMQGTIGFFGSLGFAPWLAWLIAILETAGGALMILGFCTCFLSAMFIVILLVAIFKVKLGMPMGIRAAELDIVVLVSSLAIMFTGAGRWAIPCGGKKTMSTSSTSTTPVTPPSATPTSNM